MKSKLLHITSRAILLFLAIQIINLSINSIDFKPFETNNLTEFNDINTIAEYVSEIVLGHINSFPEFSTKPQKHSQLQKHFNLKIINDQNHIAIVLPSFIKKDFGTSLKEKYLYEYFQEINPPPPKA